MFVINFKDIEIKDVPIVGGKNASLGEMINHLSSMGIRVPGGFATTARAYQHFLSQNNLTEKIADLTENVSVDDLENLSKTGVKLRNLILEAPFPEEIVNAISTAYFELEKSLPEGTSYAVRSSATAEDLANASFAGQQESLLNIAGIDNILTAIKQVYASLFTDRALSYRQHQGFSHTSIAISVGVQQMIRSDLGISGVMFTLDTETGFREVILINATYGLGELLVQGQVDPDEFYLDKRLLHKEKDPIVQKVLGTKEKKMVFTDRQDPMHAVKSLAVEKTQQEKFCLTDRELIELGNMALIIEKHYQKPMDIEWAKDGQTNTLYILQARPETVKAQSDPTKQIRYELMEESEILCQGKSVGQKIGQGQAHFIENTSQLEKFKTGEILLSDMTDPDWEPAMKRASAIITNRGGRTCHAAIIARELGIPAVVGCFNATEKIQSGQEVTVSCAQGETGFVYAGKLAFREKQLNYENLPPLPVKVMMNIGNPKRAFDLQAIPNDGVGLARIEFVINQMIAVHPNACLEYETLPEQIKGQVLEKSKGYHDPVDFYIQKLAQGIAMLASAFFPKRVIVRFSDFKTNEYANLIGGKLFEAKEENPMLGFRGASRYVAPEFKKAFELECLAVKKVREAQGFTNVELLIPFVRTLEEASHLIEVLKEFRLESGQNGLKIHMMCEVPSNAILCEEFLDYFDGFSIGSNDLTQLTLGLDRDSEKIAPFFDERNLAIKKLLEKVIQTCKRRGKYIGICGQGPSDHPDFAKWLLEQGIESLSLVPDSILPSWQYLAEK